MRIREKAVAAGILALSLSALEGSPERAARADPMTTSPEQAYDSGEIPSARAVGMGGALNALGVSTAALYLNPANMPMARVYHLEALGAFSPEAKRQTYGLAVVDSVLNTSRLAGGLAGAWSLIDPDGIHRTWTDVRAALALPLGDHVALGATGRWLRVEQAVGSGPFGPSLASGGTRNAPIFNSITFDAGATASILDGLRIAVVGHNLTNPGTALAPTTGTAAVGYANGVIALEADGMLDFTTWGGPRGRTMVGGELFFADRYAVRAGYDYDAGMKIGTASLGAGYIDPKWSIELGIRHDLIDPHASTLAVLSLRYFYDPLGAASPSDEPDSM